MSFLTDTDLNKRARNLYAGFDGVVLDMAAQLNAEAADMAFLASYQAVHPTAQAIGGNYDPAQTGTNGSVIGRIVTFRGEGASAGTNQGDTTLNPWAWEFIITDGLPPVEPSVGDGTMGPVRGDLAGYDPNAYVGGYADTAQYQSNGLLTGQLPQVIASVPLVGDVLGIVAYSVGADGFIDCFFNGALQGTQQFGGSLTVRPMFSFRPNP